MLHIWGRLSSINVRKVVWAVQETGVPFTRTDAGLAYGVVTTPEYLRLNPNAQVPTLQDGELVLWESNVIVRYLCARYAPALYPQELAARFDAERWMDWQQTSLNPAGSPAFIQLFRTPQDKRDPAIINKSVATMTPLLTLLNQHLSQRNYLGGETFSMADIPVACDIHRWFGLPQTRPFKQVDVFTDTAYLGNPLAVVLDGTGLSSADMQHFAHWTNLSETTFVLPPSDAATAQGADYQVRIFTPGAELPFAGHPTLGTCHAWLQAGGQAKSPEFVVQECGQGLVRIRRDAARLAFAAPPLRRSVPDAKLLAEVTAALGLAPQHILASQLLNNGPHWLGLLLDNEDVLLALEPDHAALRHLGQKVGVAHIDYGQAATSLIARSNREARAFGPRTGTPAAPTGLARAQVRAFAAPVGINEDPVTGSLNASLAQWLIADGLAPASYVATQGTCLGRLGQVHITQDDSGQVWVGGDVVTCIQGVVTL